MISPTHTRPKKHKSIDVELRELNDRQLLSQIQLARRGERAMTIKILHHLNEIERRKLYLELGYGSLFDYCTNRLNYSSSAAWRRIQTARCIRRHPEVLALFHAEELSLSTISLIAPILTDQNSSLILERVRGRSHRAAERVVAEFRPPVALRDRVRPVRVPVPEPADIDRVLFERELARYLPPGLATAGAGSEPGWVPSEQKFLVQFVASKELMGKLEEAQALLSNRGGSFEEVLRIVLTDFLERHSPKEKHARREKRKARVAAVKQPGVSAADGAGSNGHGPLDKPDHYRRRESQSTESHCRRRESQSTESHCRRREPQSTENHRRRRQWNGGDSSSRSRHIPAGVRDEVFTRDGGRCTYVAQDGTQCGSTRSLQVDHIRPFAAGGTHNPSNLRLLCAQHNQLAAEQTLGDRVMGRYWRKE